MWLRDGARAENGDAHDRSVLDPKLSPAATMTQAAT